MIAALEHSVVAGWTRLGVFYAANPSRQTPDLERLIIDTAACMSANPRLFDLTVSWMVREGALVARHRLARLAGEVEAPEVAAALGLTLASARFIGHTKGLDLAISRCRPAPKAGPLFSVDRSSPAAAEFVRKRASALSRRWNLWTEPADLRTDVLRPTSWIFAKNPSFMPRALFRGGLRASVLATLEHDRPEGASEAELARLCLVTRKAVHEALDHLEFCGLVLRRRVGRCYRVTRKKSPIRIAG